MRATALVIVGLSIVFCLNSCSGNSRSQILVSETAACAEPTVRPPTGDADRAADYPGLHNVVAYAPGLLSGSVPEGDAGFDVLAAMGVRTIVSVDGATPALEEATNRGIRYVHLPIGYNGMERQRTLELSRAVQLAKERDPSAPVYVHCHHGKHRSAGAAGAVAVTLGYATVDESTARMKVSGTSPSYPGLYQCVATAKAANRDELAAMTREFPSVWKTTGMVKSMVEVDEHFERLKLIEAAGWMVPQDHPDLVPAAESGRLADIFRNLQDDDRVKAKSAECREWLIDSSRQFEALEAGLTQSNISKEELGKRFKLITASCKDCHVKYRD